MNSMLQDIRYALRSLSMNRTFAAVAVLALALGIGASTAIFSVVNAVLLQPLPFRNPEQLMILWVDNKPQGIAEDISSYPNFENWRNENKVFDEVVAYTTPTVTLTGEGEPEQVRATMATAGFFQLFGTSPAQGRALLPEENQTGREQVVVISDGVWKRRLGGVSNAVGRTLSLNGRPYTVVGIMPPDFRYPERVDLWMPLAPNENQRTTRGNYWLSVIGRLKNGMTVQQAQVEMSGLARQLEQRYPNFNTNVGITIEPMYDELVGSVRPAMLVLFGSVGFVLLIACANVANLLLARSATRQREFAVRIALGASRVRLLRQMLTESTVLGLMAGVVGIGLTFVAIRVLLSLAPADIPRLTDVRVDRTVLSFSLGLSLVTGLLFGLFPALTSSGRDISGSMKSAGRGTSEGFQNRRVRRLLVISEIAIALTLLVGAGLLIKSFSLLRAVSPGFATENVLTARIQLPGLKYPQGAQVAGFYNQLIERIQALPGVQGVDAASTVLLSRLPNSASVSIEGRTAGPPDPTPIPFDSITPGFFKTMGIRILQGRTFTPQDDSQSIPVVIVNEAFARRYWPNEDALGKRLTFGNPQNPNVRWSTVVGIVDNIRRSGIDLDARPETYFPHQQSSTRSMQLLVKTSGDPSGLAGVVKETVWSIDKDQPIANIRTMESLVAERVAQRRFNMLLLTICAGVALVLAAVGIYGVMSYSVTQRTQEMGIRMALGAQRSDVVRMVLREGSALAAAGIGLGVLCAWPLMRLLATQLYETTPTDLTTYLTVAIGLGLVALLASFIPARRATKVDPLRALRYE